MKLKMIVIGTKVNTPIGEVIAVYDNTDKCDRCIFCENTEEDVKDLYNYCLLTSDKINCADSKVVFKEVLTKLSE